MNGRVIAKEKVPRFILDLDTRKGGARNKVLHFI